MSSSLRCLVLMPFGRKTDETGAAIDFDLIYRNLLAPTLLKAGFEPFRADDDSGWLIDRQWLEAIVHSDYLIADITTANPSVMYQLGLRHAVRPSQTIVVAKEGAKIPFSLLFQRTLLYRLNQSGRPDAIEFEQALASALRLSAVTSPLYRFLSEVVTSPLYRFLPELTPPQIALQGPAVTRTPQPSPEEFQRRVSHARAEGVEELVAVEQSLGDIRLAPAQFVLTLFHAYRAVGEWQHMIDLAGKMAPELAESTATQEQLALALNRLGRGEQAETILQALLQRNGASSETYGLLGRVYKDRWAVASRANKPQAAAFLDQAIEMYVRGFETDWRDPYPGVNAVTLMTLRQPPDARRAELLPVVLYTMKRRTASNKADYWDRATLLELAVIDGKKSDAEKALQETLAVRTEPWQAETTIRNLRLIREACEARGETASWIAKIESALGEFATNGEES